MDFLHIFKEGGGALKNVQNLFWKGLYWNYTLLKVNVVVRTVAVGQLGAVA